MDPADHVTRHKRHILLPEIGGPGVQRLKAARISLIGAGALGGPCALYLAAAGCGFMEIWDDDLVDLSNLQRQVQFATADIGGSKADVLAGRLRAIDPSLDIRSRRERLGDGSEPEGVILIDASDNYETRFALNRLAHESGRALVSGAALGWQGQCSVFVSGIEAGAPCYACLVPETPPDPASCERDGVVGAVTGIIGARMALETLKLVTGAGDTLAGRLLRFDGLSGHGRIATLRRDPACNVCGT